MRNHIRISVAGAAFTTPITREMIERWHKGPPYEPTLMEELMRNIEKAREYGRAAREAAVQADIDEEGCGAFVAAVMYGPGPSGGMVDTGDSKSPASRRESSNLSSGTTAHFHCPEFKGCKAFCGIGMCSSGSHWP